MTTAPMVMIGIKTSINVVMDQIQINLTVVWTLTTVQMTMKKTAEAQRMMDKEIGAQIMIYVIKAAMLMLMMNSVSSMSQLGTEVIQLQTYTMSATSIMILLMTPNTRTTLEILVSIRLI